MSETQLVTGVLLPLMSALLCLHGAGYIHRDIKPENTLFAAGRVLKLAGVCLSHVVLLASLCVLLVSLVLCWWELEGHDTFSRQ